jgi:hypothetical protein
MQSAQGARQRAADMIFLDEGNVDPCRGKAARVPYFREKTSRVPDPPRHYNFNFR